MTAPRRLGLLALFAAAAVVAYVLAPPPRHASASTGSFLPRVSRMAGVRFDPAFFYDRGLTARELASGLVARWSEAGLDSIFYRAYDPGYGANYRTRFDVSAETDYGRQDLLRSVLDEAHARGMKVYAWLTVLNHRGAWEAEEDWRARRADGEPYSSTSLPFPLCPRAPGVRSWWLAFVDELLDGYPELDGVDLAEPALSWRADEACGCRACAEAAEAEPDRSPGERRAAPLTELLLETFRRVKERGKTRVLTTVLPADAEGTLLPFAALREQTGLDVEAVLASADRPELLSAELMWQEWANATENDAVFQPGWARTAIEEVRRRVAGRAGVIAHLELTDFGTVAVRADDLGTALAAALEAGAEGYEVYDAALLEKKDAWNAFAGLGSRTRARRVLVLHTATGEGDAWQLATLFGHFAAEATVKPAAGYAAGDARGYDVLAYVGADDRSTVGEALLEDVRRSDVPVLWLGFNVGALLDRSPELGLAYRGSRRDSSFDTVAYEGASLPRREPSLNALEVLEPAKVPARVEVRAEMIAGEQRLPYALRSGSFWYFADNVSSFAVEGGSYAVLADLLHEVIGEEHEPQKLALVRLEDIHPLTPPEDLLGAARVLHARGVPFLIALVPFYAFPEKGTYASLGDQPEFVEALHEAVRLGGTIVLHGVTHQRQGESTADYEFWDKARRGPPDDRADARTRTRLLGGLAECRANGLFPLLWETPHYAAPLADYRVVSEVFSAAVERRQSADRIGTDQLYPYVIQADRFGQLLLPENLGYVPLSDQRAEPILAAAERTAVVRDSTVGFFFHVFCRERVLEEIVDGLLERGFSFPDVRTLALSVSGPDFAWSTTRAAPRAPADVEDLDVRVLDASGELVSRGPRLATDAEPALGLRIVERAAPASGATRSAQPSASRFLTRSLDVGLVAEPEETEALGRLFASVATPWRALDPAGGVPDGVTLVVVSESAGASPALLGELRRFVEGGGTVLTWGRTALSESLGVRFADEEREVSAIAEREYGGTTPLPAPRRVAVVAPSGEEVEILAEGADGGPPLLTVSSVGEGQLVYSALSVVEPSGASPYPYLLGVLQNHARLSPIASSKRLEVYFDPGVQEGVAVEDLVKRWARNGVRVVHAGAWHEYRDWTYEYDHLIELAHENGILVQAWFVLPFVSEKFWEEHPEWRETNPRGEVVGVGWRRAVALLDPACRAAVEAWMASFLGKFRFDGVNVAGLGFGGESFEKPETLAPFSPAARADFQARHGFDPREVWDEASPRYWKRSSAGLELFSAWRKGWTTELHRAFLRVAQRAGGELTLTVTLPDALATPEAAEAAGVDMHALLALRNEFPLAFQIADCGDERPWDERRFASVFEDYEEWIDPARFSVQIDLGGPSHAPTGLPLYRLLASAGDVGVALHSEDAIPDADWPLLGPALAAGSSLAPVAEGVDLASERGFRLAFEAGTALWPRLDGRPWPAVGAAEILVPPGEHRLTLAEEEAPEARLVDASCPILDATAVARELRFAYASGERAQVLLSAKPIRVMLDGKPFDARITKGQRGAALELPPGRHEVVAVTEGWTAFVLRHASSAISTGIVALGAASLCIVAGLFLWSRLARGAPASLRTPAPRAEPALDSGTLHRTGGAA